MTPPGSSRFALTKPMCGMVDKLLASYDAPKRAAKAARKKGVTAKRSRKKTARARA